MLVSASVYEKLVELVKAEDAAGLKFFLRWERDRRSYLHHRNNDGLTLLHQACLLGKSNVVHALVECGCDIEGRSSVGWTALHAGALSGCIEVVSYLVKTCASNVLAIDDMGCKPIDLTLEPKITNLLLQRIEDVEQKTAQYTKSFEKSARRHSVSNFNTKPRSSTCPTNEANSANPRKVTRVRSDTNVLKQVRFGEKNEETRSLPGDISIVKKHKSFDASKQGKDNGHRDSGIYEDFLEMRDLSTVTQISKKPPKTILILPSRSTTV